MKNNPLLFLFLLALLIWFVWFQFKARAKGKERSAQVKQKQQAIRVEREERARREAEEAEMQRKAAESAAWREEVAEDQRKRKAEKEETRRLLREERAAQEKLDRQAAAERRAAETEARRHAEAESARKKESEENARRQAEEERAQQQAKADAARRLLEDERASIRATPIAGDIQRDMREFLSVGHFFGEEHSPLAYVGYKVGKTNGLPVQERHRRLRACFQIEVPRQLADKYQTWGPPVTWQRFTSMRQHITMLADMRRERLNYEVAVSDWEADVEWLKAEFGSLADRLRRAGIG
jgi:hypothetical protein